MNNASILLFPGIILSIFLVKGIICGAKLETAEHFFYGRNKMSVWGFACNIFCSNFSFITAVFVLLFYSYQFGSALYWAAASAVAGFLIFSVPHLSPLNQEFLIHGKTLHEYIAKGNVTSFKSVRVISAITTIVSLVGFISAEIYIFAGFCNGFFAIDFYVAAILIAATLIFYTCIGGFDAVIETDKIQGGVIAIGTAVLIYIAFSKQGSLPDTFSFKSIQFSQTPPFFISMLFLVNGLWQFTAMDMWQRSLATKDMNTIKRGSAIGGIFFGVISVVIIVIGLILRAENTVSSSLVTDPFALIGQLFAINNYITSILLCLFVAAFLSTADSMLIACAMAIKYDFAEILNYNKMENITCSRFSVFLLGTVCFGVTLLLNKLPTSEQVITFLLILFSCQMVLLPSLFMKKFMQEMYVSPYPSFISISLGLLSSFIFGYFSLQDVSMQNFVPVISLFVSLFSLFTVAPFFFRK